MYNSIKVYKPMFLISSWLIALTIEQTLTAVATPFKTLAQFSAVTIVGIYSVRRAQLRSDVPGFMQDMDVPEGGFSF